jgi:hypothetical protein
MASQQAVLLAPTQTWVGLVGLEQDADVEMLNGCALKALKVLCPRVRAAAEAGVDAIDDVAGVELALQERNALVDELQISGVISELGCPLVSARNCQKPATTVRRGTLAHSETATTSATVKSRPLTNTCFRDRSRFCNAIQSE